MRARLPLVGALLSVFVIALATRIVPVVRDGAFRYRIHNDDGVYYSAAASVLHGDWPYADFLFLHPPGIIALLTPFAAIGGVIGDSSGLLLARVAWAALGAVNAVLVTAIIWRIGRVAALAAGVLYATWGAAALPEVTVHLVTVLNAGFLVAVLIVTRWPRRALWAGIAIGLACTVKIWAVAYVLILAPYVLVRRGRVAFDRFALGVVGAVVVMCAPFVVRDPGAAWQMIALDQAGRPRRGPSVIDRLFAFIAGTSPDEAPTTGAWIGACLVALTLGALITPLLLAVARRSRPAEWHPAVWLAALLALQTGMLLIAPSFYPHYAAFIAPTVALAAGVTVARVAPRLPHMARVMVPIAVLPVFSTWSAAAYNPIDHVALVRATADAGCVWSLSPTVLVTADAVTPNLRDGCVVDVDSFGTRLVATARDGGDARWQRRALAQLRQADVVMYGRTERQQLGAEGKAHLRDHFRVVAREGGLRIWIRR